MKRHYWPGAVTADGRTLRAHEAVDSEQQCFEQFDLWEKAFGNPLCEAFCDCGGKRCPRVV